MARLTLLLATLLVLAATSAGQLSSTFYDTSCKNLTSVVRAAIRQAVNNEARMGASLLRLHFHDCFVQGCDGSILLDGSSLEQNAAPNQNSARGFDVIDTVKTAVENACPGVVSCADILALSAREAVVALSGPTWTVVFGRRDSTTASQSAANNNLPPPTFNVSSLVTNFQNQGLSLQDMVALSGGHTIGQAQCQSFRSRLYTPVQGDRMDSSFNTSLQGNCPSSGGNANLSPLDLQTPVKFDNDYYKNLQNRKGLLFSDQTLYSGGSSSAKNLVDKYARNQNSFFTDFASAMVNMGNINPLTGSSGEIRKNCGKTN